MRIPRLPAKLRHQARACRAKNGFQFVRDLQEPRALLDIRLVLLTFSVAISLRSVIGLDRPSAEHGIGATLHYLTITRPRILRGRLGWTPRGRRVPPGRPSALGGRGYRG